MSVDERLRIGLSRNALGFDPDVEMLLESTLARRRGRRVRWAGAAVGVLAAACAAAVLVVSGVVAWRQKPAQRACRGHDVNRDPGGSVCR